MSGDVNAAAETIRRFLFEDVTLDSDQLAEAWAAFMQEHDAALAGIKSFEDVTLDSDQLAEAWAAFMQEHDAARRRRC